jgi:hypothetical protein
MAEFWFVMRRKWRVFRLRSDIAESGMGLPHSTTLARISNVPLRPQGHGARQSHAALRVAICCIGLSVRCDASFSNEVKRRDVLRQRCSDLLVSVAQQNHGEFVVGESLNARRKAGS